MNHPPLIGFIGAGNMARSLIGGLLRTGHPPASLLAADPSADSQAALRRLGVQADDDNDGVAARADVLVLAVKPQVMAQVLRPLGPAVRAGRPLLLSVAAGVTSAAIVDWLGDDSLSVVRAMPNTPALLGCGAAGLHAGERVSPAQREVAERIMRAAGHVEWVPEEHLIDAVTAVSGSGPAYFFLLMEIVQRVGTELGLDPAVAERLTLHTALGAARMAEQADVPVAELRRRVTSPGGTTEAALRCMEQAGIHAIVARALVAARDRAAELAAETRAPTRPPNDAGR